jgi:peptidoglycan/LPS O-acetylase OafA/YrhL
MIRVKPLLLRAKPRLFKAVRRSEVRRKPMLGTILLVILILLLVGALPAWPYSTGWGYGPGGVLGVVLVVVLILVLLGRL